MEITLGEESYAIMGECFDMYNEKGPGFLEPVEGLTPWMLLQMPQRFLVARTFGQDSAPESLYLLDVAEAPGLGASAGRWRRPEDWIDRLGRIRGWGWIGAGLVWELGAYTPRGGK